MQHPRSVLIAVEGPDGAGKATQSALLCRRLAAYGLRVFRHDLPTYTLDPVADLIRTLLHARPDAWDHRPWMSKALLYASNRAWLAPVIEEELAHPGAVVVCNRYVASNQAHMAGYTDDRAEQQRRFTWVADLEYRLLQLPQPDIVLLLTIERRFSDTFLRQREGEVLDAHERDRSYLARVSACYEDLCALSEDAWRHIPAGIMEGTVERPESVHDRVWETLTTHHAWRRIPSLAEIVRSP